MGGVRKSMQEHQGANQGIAQSIYQSHSKKLQWQNLTLNILGGQAILIAYIGLKAGLFQAIDQAYPSGIDELSLAKKLGFAPRYVQVWCQAAYAFKLLELDEYGNYRLVPNMASLLLDTDDPLYMGSRIRFFASLYEDYQFFLQHLQSGSIVPRESSKSSLDVIYEMTRLDFKMITEMVLPQADKIVSRLDEHGGVILDIGVGVGCSLIHYARRFPKAHIVGIDIDPSAVKQSQQAIAEAGLANQITVRQDDANLLKEECVYDLIIMNLVLHETGGSSSEYRNVLRRVRQALKPGGVVVVCELPYPDSVTEYRNKPLFQMLAGLQIHEVLSGGGKITMGELRNLLESTGFSNMRIADQPIPYRFVMMAEK